MEPRASIKLVAGFFVFTGLLLFAASVFFLGERGKYFSTQHPLKTFFNSAAGLHVGAPVQLGGVVVGRVTGIQLPSPPEDKVLVELNVAGDAVDNIRRDSVARIGTRGFLGDKFIDISLGTPKEPVLPDRATLRAENVTDPGALIDQGQRVLSQTERITASLATMVSTLEKSKTAETAAHLIAELDSLARSLERGDGALPWLIHDPASRRLVENLSRSAETLAELTQAVKEGPGLAHALIYDPESGRILEKAPETLQEMSSLIQAVRDGDGAIPALLFDPKTASLAYDLTEASRKLKEISAGIARGDGTLGGLLMDPTVYEDLTALLEGARRSWILRWAIRNTLESGREQLKDENRLSKKTDHK
jgi:phospholipid/cholesterol/gamma-HCH transport system substrate-binding protein